MRETACARSRARRGTARSTGSCRATGRAGCSRARGHRHRAGHAPSGRRPGHRPRCGARRRSGSGDVARQGDIDRTGTSNARLDPLGSEPIGDPALDESELEPPLTLELQAQDPGASCSGSHVARRDAARGASRACERSTRARSRTRSSTSPTTPSVVWLRQAIESGPLPHADAPAELRRALLSASPRSEAFETYLRRAFIGQKQFSIEGLDVLVPMLDEAVELAARARCARGAHRDRTSRSTQRPDAYGRPVVRVDPSRVRGRAVHRRAHRRSRGRHRRREVPPRRLRVAHDRAPARSR